MTGNPIVIDGIPLPSDTPLFLTFVAAHLAAGLIAVVAGAVAMLSRKKTGRHPRAGTVYYWALSVVFVTMSVLAVSRWSEDYDLFIFGFCPSSPRPSVERPGESFGRAGHAFT